MELEKKQKYDTSLSFVILDPQPLKNSWVADPDWIHFSGKGGFEFVKKTGIRIQSKHQDKKNMNFI